MDEPMVEMLGRIGIYAPLFLGAIGSILGCAAGGQAACGAMLDVEGGYGRLIGVSALPSSQTIYGIVVMLSMNGSFQIQAAPGMFAIGTLCGLALLFSGWFQGKCCASAIHATKSKPEVFGLSVAPAAIVEGFAVFAFVFALILAGGLPSAAGGS
ncbi:MULTISPECIES: ATP synthase subunit C [Pirellulaceae]|uniref:V-type sodium ATPase subunit K n=1 Tax=Stieleria magnilauensis TaxID=2527963 RepID=A0ABX5XVS4_9BACT|nr:ATP synthase subunit C [Rhodopirellula sp. SM50]MDV6031204.1 ATP synthase subunit C [Phycisphaera sp. RhM]PAY21601.1 V-type ATP synthase subunit K [Rhodopirellula sp. SM50]QDV83949.1 V-type sodium ATPase subunit K [Planctomycetes bacterium TBK1r]